jgi:hypothetical protein
MKTVVGLYVKPEDATVAATALANAGFSASSVRQLRSVDAIWQHLGCSPRKIMARDTAIGALLGIAVYVVFGAMVAVGEVSLGFDRIMAIAALSIFVLTGMLVGGMLGLFFGAGDLEEESRLYTKGIRQGGVVVAVRTADEHVTRALNLLRQTQAEGVKVCRRTAGTEVEQPAAALN